MIFQYAVNQSHSFFVVGLAHWNSPVEVREKFSLHVTEVEALYDEARELGVNSIFAISTCNRSELYAFAEDANLLKKLLIKYTHGSEIEFEEYGYIKNDHEGVQHLFNVAVGLDSQVLGDFQIISQIKNAHKLAMEHRVVSAEMNRLVQQVIQANKQVKRETALSSGISSTSYAAVYYLKQHVKHLEAKNVLLYGTGKIGQVTCRNLVKHIDNSHITVINRTFEKAQQLATAHGLKAVEHDHLISELQEADIMIVATGSNKPVILPEHFEGNTTPKVLIDLSVPRNISPEVDELPDIKVINLDFLQDVQGETLTKRAASIPQAKQVLYENMMEYYEWLDDRAITPTITGIKARLLNIKDEAINEYKSQDASLATDEADRVSQRIINKIVRQCANHLKENYKQSDDSLNALQEIFELEANPA